MNNVEYHLDTNTQTSLNHKLIFNAVNEAEEYHMIEVIIKIGKALLGCCTAKNKSWNVLMIVEFTDKKTRDSVLINKKTKENLNEIGTYMRTAIINDDMPITSVSNYEYAENILQKWHKT